MMNPARAAVISATTLALAVAGCRPAPPPPAPPAAERVENAALGLAVAALPEAFTVDSNEGETLRLRTDSEEGAGLLTVQVGPELDTSINLLDETKQRRDWFESEAPAGKYFGNRELRAPYGPAFTARGELDADGSRFEETWIYTLHPMANRLITLVYRYPAGGDSATRVAQLMEVLGELEPLTPEPDAGGSAPNPPPGA